MKFKVIMALIKPEYSQKVLEAARKAGATGDVSLTGRGSGSKESKSFFGLSIMDQTEVLMFLVEEHTTESILTAIKNEGKLNEPGHGIAFSLSVEKVVGLESQLEQIKERVKNNYL
ncbi:P-II family nitrogen regulator [Mongoliitalea daihaiensis]|uniref:P-II family nitrogen regulator n=1 Tax=Mongoliitalea daihaiensis TaxID=2782006 RepID=UPI001F3BF0A1|nr:P-II family nitrogen regulator [Mongoliitalea daihaiensis]UJP64072.1 P-II family nitrogen regulator [Mongoliitalea daihaiensis]